MGCQPREALKRHKIPGPGLENNPPNKTEEINMMRAVSLYRPGVLENAVSEFDRYLNSFFGDNFFAPAERRFNGGAGFRRLPPVDVRETEKTYVLEAELPGFDEKDIQIRLDGNNLTIESRREDLTEMPEQLSDSADGEAPAAISSGRGYLVRERRLSSFSRSFKLPENADAGGISASFKNGVLFLEIGKKAEAQTRVIQITK